MSTACLFVIVVLTAAQTGAGDVPREQSARWYHGRRMYDRRIDLRPDAPRAPEIPTEERLIPTRPRVPLEDTPVDSALFRPAQPTPRPPPPRRPPPHDEEAEDPAAWLLEPMTDDDMTTPPSFSGWGWLAEKVIADRQRAEHPTENGEDEEADAAANELFSLLFGGDDPAGDSHEFSLLRSRETRSPFAEEERASPHAQRAGLNDDASEVAPRDPHDTREEGGAPVQPDGMQQEVLASLRELDRAEMEGIRPEQDWPGLAPQTEALPNWRDMLPEYGRQLSVPLDPTVRAWMPDREAAEPDIQTAVLERPGADVHAFAPSPFERNNTFSSDPGPREWDPFERGQIFSPGYDRESASTGFAFPNGQPDASESNDRDSRLRSVPENRQPGRESAFREEPVFHW